ncbi:CHC2 zinc finger domain-containing protein [Variovorax paradoxus]|uniref:CHC2 zinc finger domain-containing protein n=1 Tax=Variovorax paradoxus TaxID=34073 RepID=UPI002788ADBC|nr:CHC2 zinc finger domain-containing protein [Variovorax paradoxus]MDP9933642.1 DNA primase catalytic core [Variovorax paradoxus]
MARIPDTDLQRLKEEISVQRLVEASGVALKKGGKDFTGKCPFHADDTASLVVTPHKNLWHCFGCQIGGGSIDWVMKLRGVSFRHAVELLKAELAGHPSLAAEAPAAGKRSTVRTLPAPVALDADDQALLAQTLDYYHQRLKESPEALAYLKARGLDPAQHPALIDTFKLGVADRTLGLRLPDKTRKDGAAIRERLQRIGLIRESGHEHFNGSLVVPVFDEAGNIAEVYGRKLRDDLRPGTPKHLYLPGPHAGVFNLAGVIAAGQKPEGERDVILCEALIDALTFWCAGFTNVTSAYGIEGFTADILAAFKAHAIERVLIAYDRDEAGERAAEKLGQQLIAEGLEVLRVVFPQGMDANEYARKMSPPAQALALVLRQARWIGSGRAMPEAPVAGEGDAIAPEALPSLAAKAGPSNAAAVSTAERPDEPMGELPDELRLPTGACEWRIRAWQKNRSPEAMRVNLQVRRVPGGDAEAEAGTATHAGYHMDTLDLYAARARAAFVRQAAIELGLGEEGVKRELGAVLLKLEALQDELLAQAKGEQRASDVPVLSADDETQALALLRAPELTARIVADLQSLGVVGEETNLLAAYLAALSRKLDAPLAVLIQSTSAAGKSALMDAVLNLVPPEDRIRYSAMTGQSLYYLGEHALQHKILAISEEEGVRQAAYALKLLQSEGELTMASTAKDEQSGTLMTRQYSVKGPVMLMLTTTAIDVDEELLNRCLVLSVDESRAQTAAIHARQRRRQTLAGLLEGAGKDATLALHHNAQRLLAPVAVVNPWADRLTFLSDKTRTRRDHMKYLTLIRAIALLHQHQREVKTVEHQGKTLSYIEASKADIALANRLAHEVLGRTLDELPPQTRNLLVLLRDWVGRECVRQRVVRADVRFTRRELRGATAWGDTQLKVHLARLVELEHVLVHRRGTQHAYELVYDASEADEEASHLNGLLDVRHLDENHDRPHDYPHAYDSDRSGLNGHRSGSGRPLVGVRSAGGREVADGTRTQQPCGLQPEAAVLVGKMHKEGLMPSPSAAVVAAVHVAATH